MPTILLTDIPPCCKLLICPLIKCLWRSSRVNILGLHLWSPLCYPYCYPYSYPQSSTPWLPLLLPLGYTYCYPLINTPRYPLVTPIITPWSPLGHPLVTPWLPLLLPLGYPSEQRFSCLRAYKEFFVRPSPLIQKCSRKSIFQTLGKWPSNILNMSDGVSFWLSNNKSMISTSNYGT